MEDRPPSEIPPYYVRERERRVQKLKDSVCVMCGERTHADKEIDALPQDVYYWPRRLDRDYCSNACKQRAYRLRKRREKLFAEIKKIDAKLGPKRTRRSW